MRVNDNCRELHEILKGLNFLLSSLCLFLSVLITMDNEDKPATKFLLAEEPSTILAKSSNRPPAFH